MKNEELEIQQENNVSKEDIEEQLDKLKKMEKDVEQKCKEVDKKLVHIDKEGFYKELVDLVLKIDQIAMTLNLDVSKVKVTLDDIWNSVINFKSSASPED